MRKEVRNKQKTNSKLMKEGIQKASQVNFVALSETILLIKTVHMQNGA